MRQFTIPGAKGKAQLIPGLVVYAATTGGEVWKYVRGGGWRRCKQSLASKRRYLAVVINKRSYYVHALVLTTFAGPRPEGMECCHGEGGRFDNSIDNLRWGTHKENGEDMVLHGTSARGSRHGQAKLTEDEVRLARTMYEMGFGSQREVGLFLGVTATAVRDIVNRKKWRHVA